MKKILSIILSLTLMLAVLPTNLFSIEVCAARSGTTGNCTWSLDGTVLTISGKGAMGYYETKINVSQAPWGTKITEVIIENGVTVIGDGAFMYCSNLTNITIPDSVRGIGVSAFLRCNNLTNLTIPISVTRIGNRAFMGCTSIKSVYYAGSEADKSKINIEEYNDSLLDVTWYYNSCIDKTEHTYDGNCDNECNICRVKRISDITHTYDDICDTECNVCKETRTDNHDYEWIIDKENNCGVDGIKHEECSLCHIKRNENTKIAATGNHSYDGICDTECNICKETRTGIHDYEWIIDKENNCGVDGIKHEECSLCHVKRNENTKIDATGNHAYDNSCDNVCNICKLERSISHTYKDNTDTVCDICGYTRKFYTVTYHGNGISGAPTSQTKIEDISLSLSSMSSNSYVFLGWATTPFGEIAYRSGASYKLNQDISLYAQWGNHCYYCDDTGYTTKGEYKEVKCTTCNSFSFVQANYWHCEVCNSTYVHEKNGCMDCGSNRITRYIDCPDCFDGYQDEWVTTNVMCSECSGRGYHKTAQVNAPQPELKSKTTTSVTLVAFEGVDYSLNGEVWQESNVFNNLSPGTKYTFYMRYKANSIHTIGSKGKALHITTYCSKHFYKTTTTKATTSKNGSVVSKCKVCGKEKTSTIYKASKVYLSTTEYTYNGKTKKPSVKVYDSKGNKLEYGEDYTYSRPSSSKYVGKYKIKITFKGDYTGTTTLYYTINPKGTKVSSLTAGKKSLKVKISKQSSQTTGYEIQYSTSKKFASKYTKTKKISSYKTTSVTLTSLKAKDTYYVRVRTYKTVNGKKYYSDWSSYKSKKTK